MVAKEGDKGKANYWGKFTKKRVVELTEPVVCYSDVRGKALFKPTLIQIEWEKPPCGDKHEFYFPYWITFEDEGEERYGGAASMMREDSLLELLQKAIRKGFFSEHFLNQLHKTITDKLNSK